MNGSTRWSRRWSVLVIVALTVAGLGACSSSDDTSSPDADTTTTVGERDDGSTGTDASSLPDPCSLLTAADFDEATGFSFGEGTVNGQLSSDDRRVCDWRNDDPYATGQVLVADGSAFAQSREGVESAFGEQTADVDIAGADEAYATAEGSVVGMLIGDLYVQVSYIPPGPGSVRDITVALAAKAAANV